MVLTQKLSRPALLAMAVLLFTATLVPMLSQQTASAYGLLAEREIKLSSSQTGATAVSQYVSFKAGTSSTVKSFAIDYCANSPIINDTCTSTVGTTTPTLTSATATTTGAGVGNLTGTWTVATANTGRTLTLTNATGMALTAGTVYFFTINAVVNHTTNGTFYSRILSFPNDVTTNFANGYTGTNTATNVPTDAGGIALSLADQITIQSKVQERLTFCLYTSAASASCTGNTTTNPVVLGDANGVLSSTDPSISKTAKYNITTNASFGATIRAKGATLTSGAFTISPVAAGAAGGAVYAANSEQFGLCTYRETGGGAGASAGLTPTNQYDGDAAGTTSTACTGTTQGQGSGFANAANFTYDTATADNNFSSTYGASIASKTAGDYSTGILTFLGGVTNTTEPGIYNTTLTFIATGNY